MTQLSQKNEALTELALKNEAHMTQLYNQTANIEKIMEKILRN